ncbi:MAG TPA: YgaP-like transmembrane domain [Azospirillaceae bacterium]|nr:YgaP-like transmembrane domain [Azospirillaceae bacterium]
MTRFSAIPARGLPVGKVNVGSTERLISAGLGGALLLSGYGRGRATGALMVLGGALLLLRGVGGHCPAYAALERRRMGGGEQTRTARHMRHDYGEPQARDEGHVAEVLGGPHETAPELRGKAPAEDRVEKESEMSFPASDPPSHMSRPAS